MGLFDFAAEAVPSCEQQNGTVFVAVFKTVDSCGWSSVLPCLWGRRHRVRSPTREVACCAGEMREVGRADRVVGGASGIAQRSRRWPSSLHNAFLLALCDGAMGRDDWQGRPIRVHACNAIFLRTCISVTGFLLYLIFLRMILIPRL